MSKEAEKKVWDSHDNEYDVYIEFSEDIEREDVGLDYPVIETRVTELTIEKIKLNGSNREIMKRDIDLETLIGLVEDTLDIYYLENEVTEYYNRLKD